MDTGHASPEEIRQIEALQAKIDSGSATDSENLDLALLCLEPMHNASRALELLDDLVSRKGENCWASLWLAYTLVYEFMGPAHLERALQICSQLLTANQEPEVAAGAWLLKATTLRDLGRNAAPITELRHSIALAPNWASNHHLLAQVHWEEANIRDAIKELESVTTAEAPPALHSIQRELFEQLITGRASASQRKYAAEQLDRWRAQPH